MFDFDVGKLVVIGVVALVVIGPKDLPRVLRQVGQVVGKMRRMASDFQGQFMDAMREADVADLKADLEKSVADAKLDVAFDPLKDAHEQIVKAIETDPSAAPALATAEPPPPEVEGLAVPAETMDVALPQVALDENALEPPLPVPPKVSRAKKARAAPEGAAPEGDDAPAVPKKRAPRKKAQAADPAPATDTEA
jgi:sec-independent protein translocase protein TatB